MLFYNEGGIFSATPTWTSPYQSAHSAVLGDVDGDGDLDFVSGSAASTATVLFLNEGGIFSTTPAWSNPYPGIDSVALGDMDGDGDLDLACGRYYQSSTLFLNETEAFSTTPVWASPDQNTHDVVLGDVDGDGDLDLVCGTYGPGSTLFLNQGGVLSTTPSWTSPEQSTHSVALGDVDGDGDLDLVCGNGELENSALFWNEGGVFSTTPVWSSPDQNAYWCSVALGDVDGDGDLDLVCGNYGYGTASRLFLNEDGILSGTPAWSSPWQYTSSVALGDVDADGDLDLVCGNYNAESALFFNEGGIFSATPAWMSPVQSTRSIALGDVDGDGDLDLVCGNSGASMLFLNEGDVFSQAPAWQSPLQSTHDVDLGDVDGDGDLDLVCGNFDAGSTIFINDGGVFSITPIWTSPDQMTRSIALSDIDRDGDLDLVCGNEGNESLLFNGKGNPVFSGNPLAPTNQLPNNSAFLRDVSVTELEKNVYRVSAKLFDVESDPGWIVPEYQFEGAAVWHRADILEYSSNIGPLIASPYGMEQEFNWNVSKVPFDKRGIILRLRTISIPARGGSIQHVASYRKNVGHVDVRRPEIASSVSLLLFPTVTVGDTLALDLLLSNCGNEPLVITGFDLPSSEICADVILPIILGPEQKITVPVFLEPRQETSIEGSLTIESNDPLTPSKTIQIGTDIRALQVNSKLLTTAPELPLGEAVTVVVTPLPQVRVENGWIYHRAGNEAGTFQDSIQLSKYDDNYIAIIPGAAIAEAGLEYYIKVENSGVFATDPPGAPSDSVYSRAVTSPEHITTVAQPNSGADFLEGRDIKVLASLPLGSEFVEGTLHYRMGGESAYRTSPLEAGDPLPFAVIPDSLVGPGGLEYWVEVQTLTARLTDPPGAPAGSPHFIRVTVPDLVEEKLYPAEAYRMVSIPLDFGIDFTGTLEALLSDQTAFGPYDPVKWRSFRYLSGTKAYAELSEATKPEFVPKPGKAFWLISASKNRIGTAPVPGLSTATDSAYALALEPGWNMIGNPFSFRVAWDSVMIDGVRIADAESTTVEPPVAYVINKGYRVDEEILEPFGGYWVKNLSNAAVVLRIPAEEAPSPPSLSDSMAVAAAAPIEDGWRLELRAVSCDVEDSGNYAGVDLGSTVGWDWHDRSKPPMNPGRSLSLYFPHWSWESHGDNYAADIRGAYEAVPAAELRLVAPSEELWGHIWRFDVSKDFEEAGVGDVVTLEVAGIEGLPPEARVYLIDKELGRCVDARVESGYAFYLWRREPVSEVEARFVLIVGSEEFAESGKDELPSPPERTALHQNYPNPFNPSTIVRYDVANACNVRLAVYDASGALVKVLWDGHRLPGRYEAAWDGRNKNGRSVSTGIYFTRLQTGSGIAQTRKMLLIR